jgi:pimeloyl-ACP methyl ester carboxylesterase
MSKNNTLYIIHGWTYTAEPWGATIRELEKRGHKVKMLHVPGLTEPSKKTFTIDDYIQWADQQIPDGAVALGHSNGGRILLNLASRNPGKLSQLILLDSAGVYEKNFLRNILRFASKALKPLKYIPGVRSLVHRFIGSNDYDRAPENMKRTMTNMLESDKVLDVSKITTPTAIIWGQEDTITPPRQAEFLRQHIKGSRLYIHADWPHAPYIKHPVALADAIEKVLGAAHDA